MAREYRSWSSKLIRAQLHLHAHWFCDPHNMLAGRRAECQEALVAYLQKRPLPPSDSRLIQGYVVGKFIGEAEAYFSRKGESNPI